MNQFELQGIDEVLAKLRNMPEKLQKSGLKKAVRKGGVIVRDAAQANAKQLDDAKTPNAIWKNITVQYSSPKSRINGGVVYRVGVLGGAKKYSNTQSNRGRKRVGKSYAAGGNTGNPGGDTYYWRFIELGFTHKGGPQIPARPFMIPALVANIDRATAAIVSEMGPALDRAVAKGK